MEKSPAAEEDGVAVVVMDVKGEDGNHQSGTRATRRRLIQSTIFPLKSHGVENKGLVEEIGGENRVMVEEEEEENLGSQGSKGKRKGRGKGKQTTPKKAAKPKQTTPRKTKARQTTPKKAPVADKEGAGRGTESRNSQLTADDVNIHNEHAPGPVVDLRLEAKLAAQENARLFAGKQTHPFFSSRKISKKPQEAVEATDVGSKRCSVPPEDTSMCCPPVHVFEMLQDDVSPDWRNWTFCENTSFLSSSFTPVNTNSSVSLGSEQFLSFDDLLNNPTFHDTDISNESPSQTYNSAQPTSYPSADLQVLPHHIMEDLNVVNDRNKVLSSLEATNATNTLRCQPQDILFEERKASHDNGCSSLWTNKYQPEQASEVCGNGESVRLLNEWLRSWHEKDLQRCGNSSRGTQRVIQENGYNSEDNDSDTESMGEAGLRNVLLVTGPVGSGKSAAIYACAKEQGFEVIEVSASDWRNGAHVKQKFGEAMESHRLTKWSMEDSSNSGIEHIWEFQSPLTINSSTTKFSNNDLNLIPDTSDEESEIVILGSTKVVKNDNLNPSRGANKTLILFEDVDTVFDEDRGLISTIQQLAETAKRPIILTSNSKDPVLPDQLDRLEVCFTVPSPEELLNCVQKVCAAEKISIPHVLIERLAGCCQYDIRKIILLLQFWCQGRRPHKGKKLQDAYGLLRLNLDAGHSVLPKVIPWGFPCQLSQLLEKEITKTLTVAEGNTSLLEIVEEEEFSYEEMHDMLGMGFMKENDSIQARKEAMLNRNGCFHDANECSTQLDIVSNMSNSSGSPVAFTRRTTKRRLSTVLSSLSGDELWTESIPATSPILSMNPEDDVLQGVSGEYIFDTIAAPNFLEPPTGQAQQSDGKIEHDQTKCSEMESGQRVCSTYKTVDISCVLESSYVPETEINEETEYLSKTVCCGDASVNLKEVSSCDVKSFQHIVANNLENNAHEIQKETTTVSGNACNGDAGSIREDEEVGDSHNDHKETPTKGYQVTDECSRAGFHMASTFFEKPRCLMEAGSVPETWRKLRSRHADLKMGVTSGHRDACCVVKLVSRVADLFCEADLMLGCSQNIISDSVELATEPSVESDAFYSHDKESEMTSSILQHGFCFFAKESAATGSKLGFENSVDLAREVLAFTTNTTELGKLVAQDTSASQSLCAGEVFKNQPPRSVTSLKREVEDRLYSTIQDIVPPRLYLALKGSAFHEYTSSLGQISKSEASRLSENFDKVRLRRRGRVPRHYLTSQMMLSPEDVSLLAQQCSYANKASLEPTNGTTDWT